MGKFIRFSCTFLVNKTMVDFSSISAILFDIDGLLTDGSIILDAQGDEIKNFHVRDGQLISFMQEKGILFGAISGRDSKAARVRMESLKVDFIRLGQGDKGEAYAAFKKEHKKEDHEILFIGDDVIDIPVLEQVGIGVAPSDASFYVIPHVDFQTKSPGGKGVLREVIDLIIDQRGWNIWASSRKTIGFNRA
ncbi:MAG: HAD hydrolase family protein [Bacteroidota bacterium]|nr:HAD hydrolase family protein [Bacteroidota bacterium]MDX5431256.1 HAD hydrolase family protein [Bacteroidota bacterium]MDX5469995.1 HAD hydrolase family protein [Bacteroidota bacterium]